MKKIQIEPGYIAYKVTNSELRNLQSPGACDICLAMPSRGYLVPVLNRFLCEHCFMRFAETARYYAEDLPIERKNAAYYESVIPVEKEENP